MTKPGDRVPEGTFTRMTPNGPGPITTEELFGGKKLGLELDASRLGMGTPSKRFSMVVEDGIVKELNVEAPGEFKVSSAESTCHL